jgi:heat shock protein HslJ
MAKQKKYPFRDLWKNYSFILIGITLVAFLLSACVPQAGAAQPQSTQPPAVSHGNKIGGYVELVDALRAQNATVEPSDEIDQSIFDVQAQMITVNGAEVQVFEFADEAAREAAAEQISADGSSIGTTIVSWVDQPNFWAEGRVIVLYVGQDAAIIELLTSVLGEPIAQGQTPEGESSLANTKWVLFSFGWPGAHTGVEATPVIEGSTITLEFGSGGQAGGSGGCNSYSAPYEVQANKLSIGQITSTLITCEAGGVDQQEQNYFRTLETAREFEQAEDHLVIWYGDGQDVLFFFPWRETTSTPATTSTPSVTAQPTSTPTPPAGSPERVNFAPGTTSATLSGDVPAGGVKEYVLWAAADQSMHVQTVGYSAPVNFTLTSPRGETWSGEFQPSDV